MTLAPYPTEMSILEVKYNYMQKKKKKMQLHFCELFSENIFVIFGVDKGYKELCGLEQ